MYKIMFVLLLVVLTNSCKKEKELTLNPNHQALIFETDSLRNKFAMFLAKAMADENVREFLKGEALKMFDNDYDVLFQLVKDKEVTHGITFEKYLANYAKSEEEFNLVVDKLPLLTILIPDLPSFSAEKWSISNQIPVVSVVQDNHDERDNNQLITFDSKGNQKVLHSNIIPTEPVVVVKDNERVIVKNNLKSNIQSDFIKVDPKNLLLKKGNNSFYFLDDAFDKSINSTDTVRSISLPKLKSYPIDGSYLVYPLWYQKRFIDFWVNEAWTDRENQCQRDGAYYKMVHGVTEGTFDYSYSEFITALHVEDWASLGFLADWTEGYLDFFVNVYFIDGTSGLESLQKGISCRTNDLVYSSGRTGEYIMTPIKLIPFNPARYGDTWKFVVYEYDANSTFTTNYSSSLSSKNASNASLGIGDYKIGYGIESNNSSSQQFQYTINNTSDQCGEGVLFYTDPIITGKWSNNPYWYKTSYVGTGRVRLLIQPGTGS